MSTEEERVAVANGEFGRVVAVFPNKVIVQLDNPPRRVVIPFARQKQASDADEKEDASGTGCDMELGYACTAHKMQGSDADYVIVALDEYPGATGPHGICKREWLFTSVSRARIACYLVGLRGTLRAQCAETSLDKRKTFLKELIIQYRASYQHQAKELPCPATTIESTSIFTTPANVLGLGPSTSPETIAASPEVTFL